LGETEKRDCGEGGGHWQKKGGTGQGSRIAKLRSRTEKPRPKATSKEGGGGKEKKNGSKSQIKKQTKEEETRGKDIMGEYHAPNEKEKPTQGVRGRAAKGALSGFTPGSLKPDAPEMCPRLRLRDPSKLTKLFSQKKNTRPPIPFALGGKKRKGGSGFPNGGTKQSGRPINVELGKRAAAGEKPKTPTPPVPPGQNQVVPRDVCALKPWGIKRTRKAGSHTASI